MKCKEFQYGDWCCSEHVFPMQITNVGEDYAYATFEGLEGDPWEFDDKDYPPYPIEITYDIMRKNKWEEHSDISLKNVPEYFYVKEEGGNLIAWRSGRLFIWCNYQNSRIVADMIVPCKYVHQVQQVLRLAGMTEMANNFKI